MHAVPQPDLRLSPPLRWGALAVLVAIFVFGDGPVWSHPFDVDMAAWLSYAPIPVVVLGLLAASRKLGWAAWFLNTLELLFLKLGVTYGIAALLWMVHGAPPPKVHLVPAVVATSSAPPPAEPTPWADRADLRVTVRDAEGQPVPGAVVWIAAGLDALTFAAPESDAVATTPAAWRDQPPLVLQRGQALMASAGDGRLHALRLRDDRGVTRVMPLLASGAPHPVAPGSVEGRVRLSCGLHAEEGSGEAIVLHHPHHARAGGDGTAWLRAVPALPVTIAAHDGRGRAGEVAVALGTGGETHAVVVVEAAD